MSTGDKDTDSVGEDADGEVTTPPGADSAEESDVVVSEDATLVLPKKPGERLRYTKDQKPESKPFVDPETVTVGGVMRDRVSLSRAAQYGVIAVTVLSVVAAAVFAYLYVTRERPSDAYRAGPDPCDRAVESANRISTLYGTFDYERSDDWYAQLKTQVAKEFEVNLQGLQTQQIPTLRDAKYVTEGSVVDSALKNCDGSTAVVLTFFNRKIVRSDNREPGMEYSRLQLRLRDVDGVWKLAAFEVL